MIVNLGEFLTRPIKKSEDATVVMPPLLDRHEYESALLRASRTGTMAALRESMCDRELGNEAVKRRLKNASERIVNDVLVSKEIMSYYEPYAFISSNKFNSYLPDFLTSMFIDGRPVVIERHGRCSAEHIEKFNDIRKMYGFYMVLISTIPKRAQKRLHGRSIGEYVDEYLFVENGSMLNKPWGGEQSRIQKVVENLNSRAVSCEKELVERLAVAIELDREIRSKYELKKSKRG